MGFWGAVPVSSGSQDLVFRACGQHGGGCCKTRHADSALDETPALYLPRPAGLLNAAGPTCLFHNRFSHNGFSPDNITGRITGRAHDRGLERVTGIEPALSAWEADVLPLNYTRGHG